MRRAVRHRTGRGAALLAGLLVLVWAPASALAQSSPFQGLPPSQPSQTTVTVAAPPDSGGLGSTAQTLIVLSGVGLVLAIGLLIRRDARRRAPVRPGEQGHPGADAPRPNRSPEAKARARARAKHARRQRRRNR